MFVRELYAVCDVCGKRIWVQECNSISTSSVSRLRNFYHWQVGRNGKFVCDECKRKVNFPIDWSNYDLL